MAGQQFFDILAMGSIGTKGPTNAVRLAADAAGNLKASVKGAPFSAIGGGGTDWYSLQQAWLFAQVPSLTRAIPVKLGMSPNAANGIDWTDALVEGGAVGTVSAWGFASGASVYQNVKVNPFGFVLRAQMTPPATAVGYLGLTNTAGSQRLALHTNSGVDATHYCVTATGPGTTNFSGAEQLGAPTVLADHLMHDWAFVCDGTTFKIIMDPLTTATLICAITDKTNWPTTPCTPGWHASIAGAASGTNVSDAVYAYIAP